jgi:hypothetical protein
VTRVPLDIAAKIAEVRPGTIRQWVNRGVINRYEDGYETAEILLWIDHERSQMMYEVRMGLSPRDETMTG